MTPRRRCWLMLTSFLSGLGSALAFFPLTWVTVSAGAVGSLAGIAFVFLLLGVLAARDNSKGIKS